MNVIVTVLELKAPMKNLIFVGGIKMIKEFLKKIFKIHSPSKEWMRVLKEGVK